LAYRTHSLVNGKPQKGIRIAQSIAVFKLRYTVWLKW